MLHPKPNDWKLTSKVESERRSRARATNRPGKEEVSLSDLSQQLTFLFVSLSVFLLPDWAILTSVISVSYKSEEIVMSEKLP